MKEETAEDILDKIETVLVNSNLDINQMLTIYAKITNIVIAKIEEAAM